jgi:predicted membrane-bound mannosyltransferase
MTRSPLTRAVHGALAGIDGAATMTVLRVLAQRAGIVDVTVPQKAEQWLRRTSGRRLRAHPGAYRIVERALHLGYGAAWGALFGLVAGGEHHRSARSIVAFGACQWAFGSMVLFPLLRIGRPAWRSSARENAVNIGAHLLYAAVTALVTEGLSRQPARHVLTTRAGAGSVG